MLLGNGHAGFQCWGVFRQRTGEIGSKTILVADAPRSTWLW